MLLVGLSSCCYDQIVAVEVCAIEHHLLIAAEVESLAVADVVVEFVLLLEHLLSHSSVVILIQDAKAQLKGTAFA